MSKKHKKDITLIPSFQTSEFEYMFPGLHNVLHGKLCDLQEHGFGKKSGSNFY